MVKLVIEADNRIDLAMIGMLFATIDAKPRNLHVHKTSEATNVSVSTSQHDASKLRGRG
jgi:hypothetical protein